MTKSLASIMSKNKEKLWHTEILKSDLIRWNDNPKSQNLRMIIILFVFLMLYSSILYKLCSLALNDYNGIQNYIEAELPRHEIVDRNNNILASNIPMVSLFIHPEHMLNPEQDVKKLALIFPDIDAKKIISDINDGRKFVWLKRYATKEEEDEIHRKGISGVYSKKVYKRVYPNSSGSAHVVGYVDSDNKGIAGIENSFNDYLSSSIEQKIVKPLELSIDSRLQDIVSDELDNVIEKFSAKGGVGIVADPKTGEILAMVSKPDFNPNIINKTNSDALFNKASHGLYEIGSAVKTLTLAVALDAGVVTMRDAYNLNNFKVSNFEVKDYHKYEGWHSLPEIYIRSSNIGTAKIVLESGQDIYKEYFKKLGLLDKLDVEITEKALPLYQKGDWSDLSLVTMSYGYAISTTALHFVQAVIPTVNGGILHKLTLLKKDQNKDEGVRVIKESTSDAIRKLMRLVVSHGTGKKADAKGYLVGGKTGTAELQEGKGYRKDKRRSSFIGIFPSIDPKYVVYVMVDQPQGIKETFGFAGAGWTAAPAVGKIISRMAPLYGVTPYDEKDEYIKNKLYVEYKIDGDT